MNKSLACSITNLSVFLQGSGVERAKWKKACFGVKTSYT